MDELLDDLVQEMGKYQLVNVVYDSNLHAVIVNEDSIQIFAKMIHINSSYDNFKINEKAFKLVKEIQEVL